MMVTAPCSIGDLIDRITILEIKMMKLPTGPARENVEREAIALWQVRSGANFPRSVALVDRVEALWTVNQRLWETEDDLRACEAMSTFDERFILLARSVYQLNDQRATIKREINELTGSEIVEEKVYGGSAR